MGSENEKYDILAKDIYDTHRRSKLGWAAFYNLKRKERDHWRALAQVAFEEKSWGADAAV
jgi:membrane-bound lytic murein transglycosylase MltF